MSFYTTYYTQTHNELYTESQRDYDESKSTFLLYNGALEEYEDPADYSTPIKGVRLA